jgi:PKHD-type hydroxylase
MLLHVPQVLSASAVARCRALLQGADWQAGSITAGSQSDQVKHNRQLAEDAPAAQAARALVVDALAHNALFFSAALPKKTFPPLFNRYDGAANHFGNHIDNAVRTSSVSGLWVRTDISCTLFLSEPQDYDGGELVIEDTFGSQCVKLAAGDMVLYPSTSVHRVEPVTRGSRLASFFWIESMVRSIDQRRLLFEMDNTIMALRQQLGESDEVVRLTGCYHNLLRQWAET